MLSQLNEVVEFILDRRKGDSFWIWKKVGEKEVCTWIWRWGENSWENANQIIRSVQFSSVPQLYPTLVTPWTAACQASLSITNSRSLFKLTSIESVMPSNHLDFCPPLLLLPSVFPSIRVFWNESVFRISWPKYWSCNFSINPSFGSPWRPRDRQESSPTT